MKHHMTHGVIWGHNFKVTRWSTMKSCENAWQKECVDQTWIPYFVQIKIYEQSQSLQTDIWTNRQSPKLYDMIIWSWNIKMGQSFKLMITISSLMNSQMSKDVVEWININLIISVSKNNSTIDSSHFNINFKEGNACIPVFPSIKMQLEMSSVDPK